MVSQAPPRVPQTVEDLMLAIEDGEREVNHWVENQVKHQAQARAELEQRERDRVVMRQNLLELCGFRRPVVSLKQFIEARNDLRASLAASSKLKRNIFESETGVEKAKKEILPGFATRRALIVRKSAIMLQFKRPENTNVESSK